jgi:hypothetical protein
MGNRFASGKRAIAECDRCGFRFKLKDLKKLIIKTKQVNIKVCSTCWEPDQPQLQLGMYPVSDPQALREPRRDASYYQAGYTGLQILNTNGVGVDQNGYPSEGSRIFQWGWNPVGGASGFDTALTPSALISIPAVGTVTIVTT